jgi:prepilin-type N-terminal cleavage/methylation domain-containing protein
VKIRGFTLIELIVVIALISVMLVFAVPRLHTDLLASDTRTVSKWVVLTVKRLKQESVRRQLLHRLRIDLDAGRMWTEIEAPAPAAETEAPGEDTQGGGTEARKTVKGAELELPSGHRLVDVQFAGREPSAAGVVDIRFYREGYCDYALIHMENENAEPITYALEPFLPQVEIYEKYKEFK